MIAESKPITNTLWPGQKSETNRGGGRTSIHIPEQSKLKNEVAGVNKDTRHTIFIRFAFFLSDLHIIFLHFSFFVPIILQWRGLGMNEWNSYLIE